MATVPLRRHYQPPVVERPIGENGDFSPVWQAHFEATSKFLNEDNSLQKSGGTLTGPLILAAAPALALEAATKAYVDAVTVALAALTVRVTAAEAAITALALRVTTIEGEGAALAASPSYVDDAAAAVGGVLVGGKYRSGSAVQVRVV